MPALFLFHAITFMKTTQLFVAALLGLGLGFSAHAQTPVVGTPGAMTTPSAPATPATGTGAIVPGQPSSTVPGNVNTDTGVVSPSATTPVGTSGSTMYPNGVPARNVDAGTLRSDQPVGNPPTSGSQQTRSLNRNRTRTGTTNSTSTTTRP